MLYGIGTFERNYKYSQIIICILLIGIYGLIYFNETHTIHYYFAFFSFYCYIIFYD